MTRKMFAVYAILAPTSSCKNYESNTELKNQVEEFLDTKEIVQNIVEDSRLEEIEKKIRKLTNKTDGKDKEQFRHELEEIKDRSEKKQETINEKSKNLFKDNLELGLTSISNLINVFSEFKNEFGEVAHKGFSLVCNLYSHYTSIYKSNMERLENVLSPTIDKTLAPINKKINNFIDLVNSNEKNLKISKNLKFDESGTPIYKNKKILHNNVL
ncbi:hemolysin accessory protein (plasmid) [Borreliella finlandensis]|uniref:Hemolysin accessory protein n=1 Tax=Borreliella finlandensis TaxID=498741 RepID=A0A806C6K1_9SPIR|nr:hemolysin accessory protein [Borreliella finlandensis]